MPAMILPRHTVGNSRIAEWAVNHHFGPLLSNFDSRRQSAKSRNLRRSDSFWYQMLPEAN